MNNNGNQTDELFPMPLSSMEMLHLFDSSDEFPNEIFGRLRFRGKLDREAAIEAVQLTIKRQLILRVKIDQSKKQFNWRLDDSDDPPIVFQDIAETTIPPLDLNLGFPWRVIFRTGDDETEIWFQAAHALFDGLGAIQLITNWSNFYHQQISQGLQSSKKPKRLHRLDYALLTKRNCLGLLRRSYLINLWKQPIGLLGALKFINRRPAQAFSETSARPWNNETQPCVVSRWIDAGTTLGLNDQAKNLSVRLNSIFVGQLMKTLETFASQNPDRDSEWIRVVHPMSFRTMADRKMPACNRTTIVQIDRRKDDFDNEWFFKLLDREIAVIHNWELCKLFLLAIRAMSMFPRMMKRSVDSDKCRGTAVYANLGEPMGRLGFPVENEELKIGDLNLKDFDFVGPVRSKTPVNFSIQKHLTRYRISLHFDARLLDRAQADQLMDCYQTSLTQFANFPQLDEA